MSNDCAAEVKELVDEYVALMAMHGTTDFMIVDDGKSRAALHAAIDALQAAASQREGEGRAPDLTAPPPGTIRADHGSPVVEKFTPVTHPVCRDCADFGPICPNTGKPCGGEVSINRNIETSPLTAPATSIKAQAGEGWRPIAEAPMDGTEVLLWATPGAMLSAAPRRLVGCYAEGWWSGGRTLSHVTYWMQLPAAPEASNGGE